MKFGSGGFFVYLHREGVEVLQSRGVKTHPAARRSACATGSVALLPTPSGQLDTLEGIELVGAQDGFEAFKGIFGFVGGQFFLLRLGFEDVQQLLRLLLRQRRLPALLFQFADLVEHLLQLEVILVLLAKLLPLWVGEGDSGRSVAVGLRVDQQ